MKKKSTNIAPFANETDSFSIGELTVENREDRISIYGSIDITRDKEGLAHAEILQTLLNDIIAKMKEGDLPDKISIKPAENIANPFAD